MNERERLVEDVVKAAGGLCDAWGTPYGHLDEPCKLVIRAVESLRSHDAAAKPLKWGCRVVPHKSGFAVLSAAGHFLNGDWGWMDERAKESDHGLSIYTSMFKTESAALTALASAPPPPGWVEPKVETVAANANYSLAVPSPEFRTVTDAAEIRAVLDRLPEHAPVTIQTSREGESVRSDHPGTVYRSDSLTNCVYVYGMGLSRSDITRLTYRLSNDPQATPAAEVTPDEIARVNKGIPLEQRVNELDVWASRMSESGASLASRVAEVERSCSQCHSHIDEIERANEVHSDNNGILFRDALDRDEKMQDDIAALRRDVDAMKAKREGGYGVTSADGVRLHNGNQCFWWNAAGSITDGVWPAAANFARPSQIYSTRDAAQTATPTPPATASEVESRVTNFDSEPTTPTGSVYEVEPCPHNINKNRVVHNGLFMLIQNGYVRWVSDAWTPLDRVDAETIAAVWRNSQ